MRSGIMSFRGFVLGLVATVAQASSLAASPRVLVLNETNAPPFSNLERSGFYDVVVGEALRRAGFELRIVSPPAGRALQLSNDGVTDGELNRNSAIEADYPNLVRVPEALGEMTFVAFGKDDIPGNLELLRGRPVGLIRGWKIYEQALAGRKDVIAANDDDQLFRLLDMGRIDAAMYEAHMGAAYTKVHGMNRIRALGPPIFVREQYIYLHKRHVGQVGAIAEALRVMKLDGTYQRASRDKLLPSIEGER